jgi:hypothetical protein
VRPRRTSYEHGGVTVQYQVPRREIFISYHHGDQFWKEMLVQEFAIKWGVFTDGSLDDRIDSTQTEYVHRQIREQFITGTSVTIVLCGSETWKRRYVDWEIHTTLLKRHGLLGLIVPNTPPISPGSFPVPQRFLDNASRYALLYSWPTSPSDLRLWIEDAIQRATRIEPENARVQMTNNLP